MATRKRCKARVFPQLVAGVDTAGEDCGVRTTQRAAHWSSCGKVVPTVRQLRARMGKPKGATNPGDWFRALTHPDTVRAFRNAGLQAPEVHLRGVNENTGLIHGSPVKTAIDALQDGKMIAVAESYVPWHGTKWSGSATFGTSYRDNHAVSYVGMTGDVGHRTSVRYDSLADGRRPGIATGPSTVPWSKATDAMGDLELSPHDAEQDPLGRGEWCGLVVERAKPLADSGGGPVDPPTPCEQQLADLQARYDELQADYDKLDDAVDQAQIALADIVTDLDTAQGTTPTKVRSAKSALDLAVDGQPEPVADVAVVPGVDTLRETEDEP